MWFGRPCSWSKITVILKRNHMQALCTGEPSRQLKFHKQAWNIYNWIIEHVTLFF